MDPDLWVVIITLLGLGGLSLGGLKMFLGYRVKRLQMLSGEGSRPAETTHRLEDSIAEVREQVLLLQQDIADLQERAEFTERVLTRVRDPDRLPEPR